jgi:nucleotide-binding universal stress UspA family protein
MAIALERILCPTDFSEFADFAIQHASTLAKAFDAHLVALHVVPQTLMHPELFPYLDKTRPSRRKK